MWPFKVEGEGVEALLSLMFGVTIASLFTISLMASCQILATTFELRLKGFPIQLYSFSGMPVGEFVFGSRTGVWPPVFMIRNKHVSEFCACVMPQGRSDSKVLHGE
jgi:hypothetical protein